MPEYINKETAIGKLHDYKHDALCEERLYEAGILERAIETVYCGARMSDEVV